MATGTNIFFSKLNTIKPIGVFAIAWVLTCALYIATAQAGWVIDGIGFLYNMKHLPFWDFINRTNSQDQSFYQVLTLHYYIFYKIWGLNPWLWGILYITLHAVNSMLFFKLFSAILGDTGITENRLMPLIAVVIYTFSPYISEVLICRAYFHYLLSSMLMLLILLNVVRYHHDRRPAHLVSSFLFFLITIFTLEIFYLIPILVIIVGLYYRFALNYDKRTTGKAITYMVIPQVLLVGIYFIALVTVFKQIHPHKLELNQSLADYLSKLPKYLFHIILLGRFFDYHQKSAIYTLLNNAAVLAIFYLLLIGASIYLLARLRRSSPKGKVVTLLILLIIVMLVFLMPLSFPGPELLVFYDRYAYFVAPFIFLLLVILASSVTRNKYVLIGLFCIYIDINFYFTIDLNTYWMVSDKIDNSLLHTIPDAGDRTVLLLNIPENMYGAPMIGAQPEGMFKMMKETISDTPVHNTIYDVASYNMENDYDGAHVNVINDSEIKVSLNHTGNWWWYEGHGAKSYETADYKVHIPEKGGWYLLTLKQPVSKYMMLYSVGGQWKVADASKKQVQQD
jgi:hypothetical protein